MMLSELLRKDFPILERKINGYPLIYFDNAASSLKPIQVVEEISNFYLYHYSNIHRGVHVLSEEATEMYEKSRLDIAKFINASPEEIIFVRNATEAINLVSLHFSTCIQGNVNVVISDMEHHSNIVPWIILKKKNSSVDIRVASITSEGILDLSSLEDKVDENTILVSITHVSNVLGTINPVKEICEIAHENNAYCLIDGAQSVPHMPINVKELNIDFLAFSSHKMLGPTGLGVLYVKREILDEIEPIYGGGGMISYVHCNDKGCIASWASPPEKYEAGTPHIAGVIGLASAIEYLERTGMNKIKLHEEKLTEYMLEKIQEIRGVRIAGPLDYRKRSGIVSFAVEKFSPHEVALLLSSRGIAVRSGYHCAQPLHEKLGFLEGTVRASFYLYNLPWEIDEFCRILKEFIT